MKTADGRNVTPKRYAQEYVWNAFKAGMSSIELSMTEKQQAQFDAQLDKILIRMKKLLKIEE